MNKYVLTFTVCFLAGLCCSGQSFYRTWDKGPLTPADFQKQSTLGDEKPVFASTLLLSYDTVIVDGVRYYDYKPHAVMIPSDSWINSGKIGNRNLRYFQCMFDLLEISSRKCQKQLMSTTHGDSQEIQNTLLSMAQNEFNAEVNRLDSLTHGGRDSAALALCHEKIQMRLAQMPSAQVCGYDDAGWRYGVGLGLSSVYHTPGLADALGYGSIGYVTELYLSKQRHEFTLDAGGELMRCSQTLFDVESRQPLFYERERMANFFVMLDYGYRVLDTPRMSLAPYAGVTLRTIDTDSNWVKKYEKEHLTANLGLHYRYNFLNYVFVNSGDGSRFAAHVDAKLWVSYNRFGDISKTDPSSLITPLNGHTINFQVTVGFGGGKARIKYLN